METADVVIVGAGIIGCSIAFHLATSTPHLKVLVLEQEAMPGMAATAKATGGIRHQFSTVANIELTKLSVAEYSHFGDLTGYSVNFRPHGYLFVTGEANTLRSLRQGVEVQRSLGVPSRTVSSDEAGDLVPGMFTEDLIGGTFCSSDGTAEPAAAVEGYVAAAKAIGVQFLCGEHVGDILVERGRVRGIRSTHFSVEAAATVVAAGALCGNLLKQVGVQIPATPFRRQVTLVSVLPELDIMLPLTVDSDSGFYLHRTGHGDLLLGGTDKASRPGLELEIQWEAIERLMEAAIHRVPALERASVRTTYVGLRALTPDFLPILGRIKELEGIVLAAGDNGKGFMHAPAIGTLLSEEIIDGSAHTMDLAPYRLERFERSLVRETQTF